MYIDLIYISTFLFFFPYLLKSCKGSLFTNNCAAVQLYILQKDSYCFLKKGEKKNMIGYHSLRESKDLSGEVWPLGKSRHFINLNIGLSQSTMKLCAVITVKPGQAFLSLTN